FSSVRVLSLVLILFSPLFFFTSTATTEIYPLSLHDALPISELAWGSSGAVVARSAQTRSVSYALELPSAVRVSLFLLGSMRVERDRKSTRLNSSHGSISYAVFCLKKKKRHHLRALT